MLEFYPTNKSDINIGAFPLNHDCILKVVFSPDCGIRFQYFTCQSQHSGQIVLLISQLYCVKKVECIEVDKF